MAQGVPGRLRPRIFLTFGTTRVVGHQPYAPAAFTSGEIPGTHFQRLSRPQGTRFRRWEPREKSPVTTPGIDPGTVRRVAQYLNHYATPGPYIYIYIHIYIYIYIYIREILSDIATTAKCKGKGEGLPQQAEVAQWFPGRLRPRIFLTFGTTRVVGRQPYAQAAFTPGEIPGTHF